MTLKHSVHSSKKTVAAVALDTLLLGCCIVSLFEAGKLAEAMEGITNRSTKTDQPSCPTAITVKVAKTIPLQSLPMGTVISPDGRFVYVSLPVRNTVAIVDTTNHEIIEEVKVGRFPIALAISPDGKHVFVANSISDSLSVIDAQTRQVVKTIDQRPDFLSMAFHPNGQLLYATSPARGSRGVWVINAHKIGRDGEVTRITDQREREKERLNAPSVHLNRLRNPMRVIVSPDGQYLYVANPFARTITVIRTATREILTAIELNDILWGMAITPDGERLLVTHPKSDRVTLMETKSGKVISTMGIGKFPISVAISGDGCWALITNSSSSSVSALELSSGQVMTTLKIPDSTPGEIAIAPNGRYAYVTNAKRGNILVLTLVTSR